MAAALQQFLVSPTMTGENPRVSAVAAATTGAARATTILVDGTAPHELVLGAIAEWPASHLGRHSTAKLLQRIHERPLHASAFCGAVELPQACILVCDGIIHTVFDPTTGRVGDDLIEGLPAHVEPTLRSIPSDVDSRVVSLLASLLVGQEPRFTNLDASVVDLPRFARKLASEGFDGAIRFTRGESSGFALYARGRSVLNVFDTTWPQARVSGEWTAWVPGPGTLASVEDRGSRFPAITFRQQLSELAFEVLRPTATINSGIRSDTLAEAQSLKLVPEATGLSDMRRGDSTIQSMLDGDIALADARWLLVDVAPQFEQYNRIAKWKALIEPLHDVRRVILHHTITTANGAESGVDVAAFGEDGLLLHALRRVASGTSDAVTRFIEDAIAWKTSRPDAAEMGAAVLIAPSFDEDALEAYLKGLRSADKRKFWKRFDAFSHIQGYLHINTGVGFHVLLVEEAEGRRRPLMPQ